MNSSSGYVYCEDVAITFLTIEKEGFRVSQERRSDTEKRDDPADERWFVGTTGNKEKMVCNGDKHEQCETMRNELDSKRRGKADHPPMCLISISLILRKERRNQLGCHVARNCQRGGLC